MNDEMSLAFVADREAIPDPEFYRACPENSFSTLQAALLKLSTRTAGKEKISLAAVPPSNRKSRIA